MQTRSTPFIRSPLGAALSLVLVAFDGTASAAPHIPLPWYVQTCDDDGPFSLRDIVENKAQTGDVVDLSQLPCAAPSLITLTTGEITVAQDDLTIRGTALTVVTVSGNHASRVFHHTGTGALTIDRLRIEAGTEHRNGDASGGCILSYAGSVVVHDAVVTGCTALADTGYAFGGAISAPAGVTLMHATISNNEASATTKSASGGAIFTLGGLASSYSTIASNRETDGAGHGSGGAVVSLSGMFLAASTVAGNSGHYGGALFVSGLTTILDSTISGNTSGGSDIVRLTGNGAVVVANSTIAENHVYRTVNAGALYIGGMTPPLIESTIIGRNTAGPGNVGADLFAASAALDANGHDNLVMTSNVIAPPPGVITLMSDPKLGPLQPNGGSTPTHALLRDSPARGAGNNDVGTPLEQRGPGYPRTSGGTVDIGAVQFEMIFVDGFAD